MTPPVLLSPLAAVVALGALASPAGSSSVASTAGALRSAKWTSNSTLSFSGSTVTIVSDGLPPYGRAAEYAVPKPGSGGGPMALPTASTAVVARDPSAAQQVRLTLTTRPRRAAKATRTGGGTIGIMVTGGALFNPFEADSATVATRADFTIPDASGHPVGFLDSCNGHPNGMRQYHYHALPTCITARVDKGGPSHVIGVALDGFPIYGDRDVHGRRVTAGRLDRCNGITSPTPEFPKGIYHYVLLDTKSARSSIRCLRGRVPASVTAAVAMPPPR